MTFKSFFVHYNRGPGKLPHSQSRGFTAFVEQVDHSPRQCLVQITFCSPKDQFCKKDGRKNAQMSRVECINKRQLPAVLEHAHFLCAGEDSDDYNYVLKYVV